MKLARAACSSLLVSMCAVGVAAGQDAPASELSACVSEALESIPGSEGVERDAASTNFMVEGQSRSTRYEFQAAECVGFLAVGHRSVRDINLYLFTESGIELTADVSTRSHGYVRYCGAEGLAVVVAAHMYGGQGEVRIEPLRGGPPSLPDLNRTVGGCFAGGTSTVFFEPDIGELSMPPSFQRIAEETAVDLSSLGYQRMGSPIQSNLPPRRADTHPVQVSRGECYAVLVVGSADVIDLDVFVRSPDGREVGRDDGRQRDALVRFCAEASSTFGVEVRMYSGGGDYSVTPLRLTGSASLQMPAGVTGTSRAAYAETVAWFRSRGVTPEAVGWGLTGTREPARFTIPLRAGQCYLVAAVGAHELTSGDLDLMLFDEEGRRLGWDLGVNSDPRIYHCAERDTSATVTGRSYRARGRFLVMLGEVP